MNGVKRGLFSNEAGAGSAPCAAAAAECDTPVKAGLTLSLIHICMPTVLANVNDLLEKGVLEETGEYASTGGRKAKSIGINLSLIHI